MKTIGIIYAIIMRNKYNTNGDKGWKLQYFYYYA